MSQPISYKRHRFPPQLIPHAVWLYYRFPLSLRLVEKLVLERGIVVSYDPQLGREIRPSGGRQSPGPRSIEGRLSGRSNGR